jgi:uncharacterized membrane protein YdjX (TVP38/TMEM64 family)
MVSPDIHDSWLESHSMQAGRIRFLGTLRAVDPARVHLVYPQVSDGARSVSTMVHAKVMIVDDAIIRVGSSNLNNRSMGTDTECDLIIMASNAQERARIRELRDRLIGDHCGATAAEVAAAFREKDDSIIAVAKTLSRDGHRLMPIEEQLAGATELIDLINGVADPERPIGAEEFVGKMVGSPVSSRSVSLLAKVVIAGVLIVALALLWHSVPLAEPSAVRAVFVSIAESRFAPFLVVGAFVLGGLVMFPVTVLIAATAAAFGPWFGFTYAVIGALASALTTYAIGAAMGKRTLRDLLGPQLNRIRQHAARRGVITMAALRMVPVAPFTVVNLVAGASSIPVFDYVAGTLVGMLPGLIVISAVGHQFARILTAPSPLDFAWLAAAVIGWIALSIGVQAVVSRYWSGRR